MRRPSAIALVLALVAVPSCGPQPTPPGAVNVAAPASAPAVVHVPAPAPTSQPPAPAPDVKALLSAYVVSDDKPARSILFTWTTREQADDLLKNKVLLTRSESPTSGASYFDQVLAERARDPKNKLAALLRSKAYAKHRYAWPSPWATRLGWPGEDYGDILIGVVLKPEALLVKVRARPAAWEVIDLQGNAVALDVALAAPQRIAAAYFVQDVVSSGYMGSFAAPTKPRLGYREYVLFNESMVAEYSIGTARERDALEKSIAAIEAFASTAPAEHGEPTYGWNLSCVTQRWPSAPSDKADAKTVYEASLAIPSQLYEPTTQRLRELARTLGKAGDAGPSTHAPTAVFPADQAKVPQPAPKVVRPSKPDPNGTY